jgi:hypothetical protein
VFVKRKIDFFENTFLVGDKGGHCSLTVARGLPCNLGLAIFLRLCFNILDAKAREVIGHLRNEPVTGSDTWTTSNIKLSVCARILYVQRNRSIPTNGSVAPFFI